MEIEKFEEFFRTFYEKDLLTTVLNGKKSVEVDFSLLDKFDPKLADKLLNDPENTLKIAREAISNIDLPKREVKIEPRFKNLPEKANMKSQNLRSENIGKFVCLNGVVRRVQEVKPGVSIAIYQCPDCGNKMEIEQKERFIKSPIRCDNPECGRKSGFILIDRQFIDKCWITISDPTEIKILLIDDLTNPEKMNMIKEGNIIKINGIYKFLSKNTEKYIEVNYIDLIRVAKSDYDSSISTRKIKEKDIIDLISLYPFLIEEGLNFRRKEIPIKRGRIDLLFIDSEGNNVIAEVKAPESIEAKTGKNITQLVRYTGGFLKEYGIDKEKKLRKMLICCEEVEDDIKKSCEHYGIEIKILPKKIHLSELIKLLKIKKFL